MSFTVPDGVAWAIVGALSLVLAGRFLGLSARDFDADLRQLRELSRAWVRMRSAGMPAIESARPTLSPPPGTGPAGLK